MKKRLSALTIPVLAIAVFLTLLAARATGYPTRIFPHAKHVEAGVECGTCHPAAESESLKTSLLPPTTTCTAECHEQAEIQKWGWTEITPRHSGFRTFSHKAHLAMGKQCVDCHNPSLPQAGVGAAEIVPNHAICGECHNGVKQSNECETCHTNLHEERLTGLVKDPSQFKPLDHHPDFIHDHQFAVRLEGSQCSDCHRQEDYCSTCHQGMNLDVMVHERNWLYTHPVSARKSLNDCASCHDIGTYCTECHLGRGIMPGDHAAPNWRGSLHAETARRDMEVCASCHDAEEAFVCSSCHRDTGVQGDQPDRNIHPPSFRNDAGHGYWHDDPGAACFSCHTRPNPAQAGVGFCGYCHGEQGGGK